MRRSTQVRADVRPPEESGVNVRPAQGFNPWLWQPSGSAWFARLHELASRWQPSPELGIEGDRLRRTIQESAAKDARWLMHPCVNALTLPRPDTKAQRDFQLALWTAMNTGEELGSVTLAGPVWAWSPSGGMKVAPGSYELAALAAILRGHDDDSPLPVDPWARSIKVPFHQLWRDLKQFGAAEQASLKSELEILLRAIVAADRYLPDCLAWARSRTKVVIPLRRLSGEHASSSSASELPGVVFLTLHHEVQAIEALVHESAHQHLFTAEAAGALVDPRHTALYKSPLRVDARPLRGILLACHALAYIAAFYSDALRESIASARFLEDQLEGTRLKLDDALGILLARRAHLTAAGRDFVDHTVEVGRYGG